MSGGVSSLSGLNFAYLEDYDLCESLYASECVPVAAALISVLPEGIIKNKNGKRYGETENERKGGEKVMSQTRVISRPHLRTPRTTRNVMMHVTISLIPALFGSNLLFRNSGIIFCQAFLLQYVLTEYIWQKITKKQVTAGDFGAVVTGLLLAFNMPVTVPVWRHLLRSVFSILVVKQMFGGIEITL